MSSPPGSEAQLSTRLLADRRAGTDRRNEPRRVGFLTVVADRRRLPDRRQGPDRRSTVERRGLGRRAAQAGEETPAQHVRNALQLLHELAGEGGLSSEGHHTLAAAIRRMQTALRQLERRP